MRITSGVDCFRCCQTCDQKKKLKSNKVWITDNAAKQKKNPNQTKQTKNGTKIDYRIDVNQSARGATVYAAAEN